MTAQHVGRVAGWLVAEDRLQGCSWLTSSERDHSFDYASESMIPLNSVMYTVPDQNASL